MKAFPFWAWFHIARKVAQDDFPHTDKKGMPDLKKPSYRFGQRLTLPANYWDGGPWAMPLESISADDPGGPRSRLFVYLQNIRLRRFNALNRFFPRGTGLNWRYETLRGLYGLSPEDARLVIGIEEGKEYSESAMKVARHRERQDIEDSTKGQEGFTRQLREMYPEAEVIRIPTDFPPYWPLDVVTFFMGNNLSGRTWWIPRPKNRVTFSSLKEPSHPQPTL